MTSRTAPVTLLTGGTGFLGSHIGAALLRSGEEVVFLVRGKGVLTGTTRLEGVLDWHGIEPPLRRRVKTIEGGLTDAIPAVDRIIHCLSDTSFSERNRERIWATNVDSLEGILDFAIRSRIRTFIYVSTAYVAGERRGPCPEEPVGRRDFFNVYEESKAAAEGILLRRCQEKNIRLCILRPSIVTGDSRTGRTFRFNALYYPVKTALFLARLYREDIRDRGGEKAREAGVTLEPDGALRLPLRIESGTQNGINLIPVDFFTEAFLALTDRKVPAGIYHIVNPRQTGIADIIDYARDQFQLRGIRRSDPGDFRKTPPNSLERLYQRYLQAYLPYINDERVFLRDRSSPILQAKGIDCPEFDQTLFRRCMSYAVDNQWRSL